MATIKSYTDLEQSETLAEILPLESADMYHSNHPLKRINIKYLPCWSLTALLYVLDFPSLTQNKEDEWEVCVPNHKSDEYIEVSADNPVDACYELILKLKELNLL